MRISNQNKVCIVGGCDKQSHCKGMCRKHYKRNAKYGNPLIGGKFRSEKGEPIAFVIYAAALKTDACIEWPFGLFSGTGYGQIKTVTSTRGAHRLIMEMFGPPIPDNPEIEVAHSCNNRKCVNLRHLRWATGSENQNDRVAAGNPNGKLSRETAIAIFRAAINGDSLEVIASRFDITKPTIIDIAKRRIYAWATLETEGEYIPRNTRLGRQTFLANEIGLTSLTDASGKRH